MTRLETIASVGRRALPNHWDVLALGAILAGFVGVVHAFHGINVPLPKPDEPAVNLDYWNLPYYALRTILRMFAALVASFIFTFTYATLAAKSRRMEMVLIPILDILQSVPILGFLSFTVTFFLGLFPGNVLGAESAAVFAVFTSQAWNMAFSFYQSLRTVPRDLDEVSRGFRLTGWQKFWQLEAPFAVPGLIWNTMMSMSGGWFFVVAAEAITVGDTTITLPGVGSYIAAANDQGRWDAIIAAVVTMGIVILIYDQLLFRPIIAWAGKFRVETTASQVVEQSWALDILQRTFWLRNAYMPLVRGLRSVALWRIGAGPSLRQRAAAAPPASSRVVDLVTVSVAAIIIAAILLVYQYAQGALQSWTDTVSAVFPALMIVLALMGIVTLILWVLAADGIWRTLRRDLAASPGPSRSIEVFVAISGIVISVAFAFAILWAYQYEQGALQNWNDAVSAFFLAFVTATLILRALVAAGIRLGLRQDLATSPKTLRVIAVLDATLVTADSAVIAGVALLRVYQYVQGAVRSQGDVVSPVFPASIIVLALTAIVTLIIWVLVAGGIRLAFRRDLAASLKASRVAEMFDPMWLVAVIVASLWAIWLVVQYVGTELTWSDALDVVILTLFTLVRVIVLMAIASAIWVPVSVWIGLRPRIAERVQPLAQFLAAFPVNILFGAAVSIVLAFNLNPDIWLSLLIVFGTQWYIVFNVIAGAAAFPNDLKEAAANFHVRGWQWWKNVILPGVFPYYFTGAITASGGSWNASIVAEYVKWKDNTVVAHGVGAYIAQATEKGDFPKIVLGVAIMSIFVTLFNRLFWRQLYAYAERRLRL